MALAEQVVILDVVAQELPEPSRKRKFRIGYWLAFGWLVLIGFLALFNGLLPLQSPRGMNRNETREAPSWDHWLGTDNLSRDIFSRIASGARTSLFVGLSAAIIATVIGTGLGLLAGNLKGWPEGLIMLFMDVLLAIPALILVIALTSFMGAGTNNIILAISILGVPAFARIARAQTLSLSNRDFVKAARVLGATRRRVIFKEIMPNIVPIIAAYFLVTVSLAIVIEGALSFLGIGVSRDQATWGGMVNDGRSFLKLSAHITAIPAVVLFLTVLSLNALGERILRRSSGPAENKH